MNERMIADQNRLARPVAGPPSVTVRILVAGRYNGPNHKSLGACAAGDVVETAAGDYAERLVAAGLVEVVKDEKAIVSEPAKKLGKARR